MKYSKFLTLKELWENKKQQSIELPKQEPKVETEEPVIETITPVVEEVKDEPVVVVPKPSKKKTTNA
jgi:hypothetical protein